jgi:uncharacterized protein (TIGR02284 family)
MEAEMKDSRSNQPDRDDVASILNGLIETCKDGSNGFRTAADGVEDASLKRLFTSYSEQRAQFAAELERVVASLGGNPPDTGHIAGAVHRGWINLKSAITGKDDGAIISECERGEDFAKERYQKALENTLPADVRAAVERQYMQVKEAHDHVRSLERTYTRK